ncbi:MAG: hypothetical protein EON59_08930 [Alphaproteobacteria bacterium]|nr:MAG: hypothetical protein EON59_08930 [Alphaproteobacteria bacterium]
MSTSSHSYLKRAAIGIAAASVIGLAVVVACNTVWAIAGGFPIATLWDEASPAQVLLASFPYLVLAIFGITARRPWFTGLCLTAAFWGYYLWDITHYEGGGANIGLGILMMLSPIPITGASLLALATLADGRRADDMAAGR